eukprot:gnl/TRDRNA2_/TRDRNA2_136314_c0_seq1.p1 gnl/TRDRNA2_/TRDRNA2_136314_c0~~gnl/TRDRNA2_/TRDRNA2_136314_c0_seq1.p1  ORF type:complete len:406 (+),score=61.34 gnl/TRDRNA2_/TRDRNA2_136314_c0_seq1:375-1592(+)
MNRSSSSTVQQLLQDACFFDDLIRGAAWAVDLNNSIARFQVVWRLRRRCRPHTNVMEHRDCPDSALESLSHVTDSRCMAGMAITSQADFSQNSKDTQGSDDGDDNDVADASCNDAQGQVVDDSVSSPASSRFVTCLGIPLASYSCKVRISVRGSIVLEAASTSLSLFASKQSAKQSAAWWACIGLVQRHCRDSSSMGMRKKMKAALAPVWHGELREICPEAGRRCQELRVKKGWSQKELAEKLKPPQKEDVIRRLEADGILPDGPLIAALNRVLGSVLPRARSLKPAVAASPKLDASRIRSDQGRPEAFYTAHSSHTTQLKDFMPAPWGCLPPTSTTVAGLPMSIRQAAKVIRSATGLNLSNDVLCTLLRHSGGSIETAVDTLLCELEEPSSAIETSGPLGSIRK